MGQDAEIEIPPVAVAQKLNAPPGTAAVTYGVSAPPGSTPVVAVPAGNFQSSSIPMWQQEKQGAKCCGCCCDYRRAVVMIAIITLILRESTIFGIVFYFSLPDASTQQTSNELTKLVDMINREDENIRMVLLGISTVTAIASLIGALKFNAHLVALKVVGYIGKYWSGHYLTTGGRRLNLLSFVFVTFTFVGGIIIAVGNQGELKDIYAEEGYNYR